MLDATHSDRVMYSTKRHQPLACVQQMAMRHSIFRALTCATVLALVVAPAFAQEAKQPTEADIQEAKRRYQRGRELYEDNDINAALVEIRRAYDLAPNYKLLFDIGQICYQVPDYPCALRSFKQYLADGGASIPADRKAEVEKDIGKLEGRVATLKITANRPGAEILVDDVVVGTTPLAAPVIVGAGRRKVVARMTGTDPVTKALDVAGTDVIDVVLDFAASVPVDKPPPARVDKDVPTQGGDAAGKRSVPLVPWVVTGAFAVGAGIAGGLAMSASSEYRTKLDTFGTTRKELDEAHGDMKNKAIATDVLLGLTAASAVTSIILTVTAGPKTPAKKGALEPVKRGYGAKGAVGDPQPQMFKLAVGPTGVWINGSF